MHEKQDIAILIYRIAGTFGGYLYLTVGRGIVKFKTANIDIFAPLPNVPAIIMVDRMIYVYSTTNYRNYQYMHTKHVKCFAENWPEDKVKLLVHAVTFVWRFVHSVGSISDSTSPKK